MLEGRFVRGYNRRIENYSFDKTLTCKQLIEFNLFMVQLIEFDNVVRDFEQRQVMVFIL